jgi:hypothetical protein
MVKNEYVEWNNVHYTQEHNNKRVININFSGEWEIGEKNSAEKKRKKMKWNICTCDIYTQLKAEFNFHFYIKTQKKRQRSKKWERNEKKKIKNEEKKIVNWK